MFCRYCGKEIKDDTNFCPYCGHDQRHNDEEVISSEEKSEVLPKESKDLSTLSLLLLCGSIIIIILSAINFGIIVKYITLAVSAVLSGVCLFLYIKKKVKYDFLSFAISITSILLNIGLIVYVNALI